MEFTFQINIVGKVQADSPEKAKELIKNEIENLKPEDYHKATDFYYINEKGYQHDWILKNDK
jgi:hypothetical protein